MVSAPFSYFLLPTVGVVLDALVAHARMPVGLPGVLVAFVLGALLYYGLGPLGWLGAGYHTPAAWQWRFALPWPTLQWVGGLAHIVPYLPLILPFGLDRKSTRLNSSH